jgi:dephospho-CoA kinase
MNSTGRTSDRVAENRVPAIGLTGAIGSGKSAAAELFRALGATVVDADALAREVVTPGSPGLTEVATAFGTGVLAPDGTLDRKALGRIVFASPERRAELERILHPKIRSRFLDQLGVLRATRPPLIVYAVPLLFESGYPYDELDYIVVVYAPRETCISRTVARDGCTRELAEQKYDAQMPIEEKVARATFVLDNSGSVEALKPQVEALYRSLTSD